MSVLAGWIDTFRRHRNILWALLLRELSTRYGRDNIGFLWLLGEPLLFCVSVLIMWSTIKPEYEHGIKVIPFVVTGYMPILLIRHMLSHGMAAGRANTGLLYHRDISVLHLFVARCALEFVGLTLSFVALAVVLWFFGELPPPPDLMLVIIGWAMLGWLGFGLALIFGALFSMFDFIDRFVQVITYVLVPLSGTFYMAAWIPAQYRKYALYLPFLHTVEMIRGGFFGEFVTTYYSFSYVAAWGAGFTLLGLLLLRFVRARLDVE